MSPAQAQAEADRERQRHEAVMHWNNLKTNASFHWFVNVWLKEEADNARDATADGTAETFLANQTKMRVLQQIQRDCKTRIG